MRLAWLAGRPGLHCGGAIEATTIDRSAVSTSGHGAGVSEYSHPRSVTDELAPMQSMYSIVSIVATRFPSLLYEVVLKQPEQ